MGQTMTETVKGQAALIARDCLKLTPPIGSGSGYRPLTEGFPSQLRAGQAAIMTDLTQVFRSADAFRFLSLGETAGKLAKAAAGLAKAGRWDRLRTLTNSQSIQRMEGLVNRADATFYESQRTRSKGRPSPKARGYLLHTGTVPRYRSASEVTAGKLASYGGLNRLYQQKAKLIGIAKAGWVKAIDELGGKRGWAPRWVRRHAAKASGSSILTITGGLKATVVAGNGVPYIQEAGALLRVVDNAMRHRRRNLDKQITNAIRAQKRARDIGIK